MALSKKNKQKSDLLTAALIAGGVIGLTLTGVGLYNLNNSVDSLKSENMELKKNIDSLNKDLNSLNILKNKLISLIGSLFYWKE